MSVESEIDDLKTLRFYKCFQLVLIAIKWLFEAKYSRSIHISTMPTTTAINI